MSDFGKLEARFWQRGTGKRLRGDKDAQILAMYFMSCENARSLGMFYLPWALLTTETGLTERETRLALGRLESEGFAFYDRDEELAWVPGMAIRRIGDEIKDGDKRRTGLVKEYQALPRHRFRDMLAAEHGARFGLPTLEKSAAGQGASKGLRRGFEGHDDPVASPSEGQTGLEGIDRDREQEREQSPAPAHAHAHTPARTREARTADGLTKSEREVLDALAAWPALAPLATVDMVREIRATASPAGWSPDDVLAGITDLGEKQGLAKSVVGEGDPVALAKTLAGYIKSACLKRRAGGASEPGRVTPPSAQGSPPPAPSRPAPVPPRPDEIAGPDDPNRKAFFELIRGAKA